MSVLSKIDFLSYMGYCKECGCAVSKYLCNADLISVRPEAAESDYWVACNNEECVNRLGEEMFQTLPNWILPFKS